MSRVYKNNNSYEMGDVTTTLHITHVTKGTVSVTIDTEDYEWAAKYRWEFMLNNSTRKSGKVYKYTAVVRHSYEGNKTFTHTMARELVKAPANLIVDHINGVTTDNRKSNLRLVSKSGNAQNRVRVNLASTSGIRGVSWDKRRGAWMVRARILNGKYAYGGRFYSKEEAEVAAKELRRSIMPFCCEEAA